MTALGPVWQECAGADPYATVFQSFAWNMAAAQHFGDREQPYIIAVESGNGAVIIPAAITSNACTLLGESLSDYRGVLSSEGEGRCLSAAWKTLAALGLPLRFTALRPEHHPAFDQLSTQAFVGAPYLSGTTSDEFVSSHSRMFSRLRKLQRLGFELCNRSASDAVLLRWLYEKKAEADPESLFHDDARVAMLLQAFAALHDSVEVFTLERAGKVIAAAVAFRDRVTMRFYTNWYDAEWAHFSPGMVLLYEMARRALAEGLCCDFMTGEQPYKMRLANGVAHLRRVEASVAELRRAAERPSYNEIARPTCPNQS